MDVVVVGSVHRDLVLEVPHHPSEGETILATAASSVGGGKGANQAVAAARLGAAVSLVGRVGSDPDGDLVREDLARDGIDLQHLHVDPEAPTGIAVVTVDGGGQNRVIVAPGASGRLAVADIRGATGLIGSARVVALQQEVSSEVNLEAARAARGLVQLDPAPVRPVPPEMLQFVGVLIPNEVELQQLVPDEGSNVERAARLRESLGRSPRAVIVTLGSRGALLIDDRGSHQVPAPRVTVVDTTGAGDAFRGAIARELARGTVVSTAVEFAVRAGAAAASRLGAQPSMHRADELAALG